MQADGGDDSEGDDAGRFYVRAVAPAAAAPAPAAAGRSTAWPGAAGQARIAAEHSNGGAAGDVVDLTEDEDGDKGAAAAPPCKGGAEAAATGGEAAGMAGAPEGLRGLTSTPGTDGYRTGMDGGGSSGAEGEQRKPWHSKLSRKGRSPKRKVEEAAAGVEQAGAAEQAGEEQKKARLEPHADVLEDDDDVIFVE